MDVNKRIEKIKKDIEKTEYVIKFSELLSAFEIKSLQEEEKIQNLEELFKLNNIFVENELGEVGSFLDYKYSTYLHLSLKKNNDMDISNDIKDQQESINDIEEIDETGGDITIPFDPNLIKIRRDPYTLGELIDRIEYEEVNFKTAFQRKEGLWNETQMSRLIESILLKLPLPAFYFSEDNENNWEVIDGLQRCSTLKKFIVDKSLKLQNLEFLKQFDYKYYMDLPRDLHRRIKTTPIVLYVVEKGTPKEVKFNIFKRINTGGLILTPQEIRHALNQGKPAEFIAELADLEIFKKATCYRIKTERMEDRDFITRFVSFYLIPYEKYLPDLDSFLTRGMSEINNISVEEKIKLKENFIKSMNFVYNIFGDDAFRKRVSETDRRKPINKALFEVLSVSFSLIDEEKLKILELKAETFKSKFRKLNNDLKFRYSITSGTGQKESVLTRFKEINRIIMETINGND
ncbi:MAG: DUF262 domain-containing protein [Leptospiraceae bacterium]|nr:DUF262 domain-containing protein [Leptospiraceae bacterium]MCP5498694.1 DUF262 domain-containing protein [Leptospiraceae bacterium]